MDYHDNLELLLTILDSVIENLTLVLVSLQHRYQRWTWSNTLQEIMERHGNTMSGTEQRVECAKHTSAKNLLVVNSQERVVLFFTWVRAEQLLREQVLPTVSLNVLRESSDQSNTESEGPTFRSVTLGAIVLSLFTSTIISLNMLSRCLVAIQLTLCLLIQHAQHLARAGELSTTIDDGYGDTMTNLRPRYLPAGVGVWTDQTCEGCPIRPDLSQTFRETYTAATRRPGQPKVSLTISFTGM